MACFLVPAAEAVVTTVIEKVLDSSNRPAKATKLPANSAATGTADSTADLSEAHGAKAAVADASTNTGGMRNKIARKLRWLNIMLWGGSALLCLEHIWHGEVVPFPPFLTAMPDPVARAEMLHEMATAGVLMAVLITAAWGGMVAISTMIEKRNPAVSREAGE